MRKKNPKKRKNRPLVTTAWQRRLSSAWIERRETIRTAIESIPARPAGGTDKGGADIIWR